MTDRRLYLHETVDIIGQGQYAYMEHVAREPVQRMPSMMSLQGTFFVCAAGGGRWPQVVNIWDLGPDGWSAWARNADRLNLKRRRAFYGDWWDEAAQWRSGGLDRLCGAGPGCPTTEDLVADGVRGTLFLHEVLSLRPGSGLEFLQAVAEQRVPLMHDHGHRTTGLYEVISVPDEVVLVWATDVSAHARYRQARDTTRGLSDAGTPDPRILAWDALAAGFVTGGRIEVMTPAPGTVYGPADWEDASLDDWLE